MSRLTKVIRSLRARKRPLIVEISAPSPAPSHSRPASIYLGNNTALTRTIDGLLLYVDTRDISLAPGLLMNGAWEAQVTLAMRRVVKPGMRVADIGANCGYYTTLLAQMVGRAGFVYAFEPNPRMFELLVQSVEINGYREFSACHRIALSDRAGESEFFLFEKHMGGSSFTATPGDATSFFDALQKIVVQTKRLDDVKGIASGLDFIKLDAEGAEMKILAGAQNILDRRRELHIFMEFVPVMVDPGTTPGDALDFLRSKGFHIYRIADDGSFEPLLPAGDADLIQRTWSELYLCRT